jgi:hypothetical protein
MNQFISPSETPNAAATFRSPASLGRQIAHRIRAANASRRNAAPAGPSSSNSVTANAAPTCSDPAAASTMPTAAARPRLTA